MALFPGQTLDMSSWGGLIQGGLDLAGQIYTAKLQAKAQKAAAKASASDFPQLGMGLAAAGPQRASGQIFNFGDLQTVAAMGGNVATGSEMTPYSSGYIPTKPVYTITTTGRVIGMRSMGSPMLWSGDFAAVKRVARVARKLGRFVHKRRPR